MRSGARQWSRARTGFARIVATDVVSVTTRRSASRSASASGSPASRISACVCCDVVRDAAEMGVPRVEVDQQVRRARVAVARLADRARVEQPAALVELDLAAALREAARERAAVREPERDRDVAVADEHELGASSARAPRARPARSRMYSQTGSRGLPWKSSTPSRSPFGSSVFEVLERVVGSSSSIVQRALVAASGENVARSTSPIAARSWFPSRQTSERVARLLDAAVRLRAVADDVAEAPDLVDALVARRRRAPPRTRASCRGCPR